MKTLTMLKNMHVDRPRPTGNGYVVRVRKARSPRAPVVEAICSSTKNDAYQNYKRLLIEVKTVPRSYVDVIAKVIRETEGDNGAYLLVINGVEAWFPKKCARDNQDGTFSVLEEMAYDKGVI